MDDTNKLKRTRLRKLRRHQDFSFLFFFEKNVSGVRIKDLIFGIRQTKRKREQAGLGRGHWVKMGQEKAE